MFFFVVVYYAIDFPLGHTTEHNNESNWGNRRNGFLRNIVTVLGEMKPIRPKQQVFPATQAIFQIILKGLLPYSSDPQVLKCIFKLLCGEASFLCVCAVHECTSVREWDSPLTLTVKQSLK